MTDLERAECRVEAFNDMAAHMQTFSLPNLSPKQNAEVQRLVTLACTNAACMVMVEAGVQSFADLRARGSSEWPAK